MIATRHAEITKDELREEGQVKSNKNAQGRKSGPALGIHAAGYFGPPEVNASQIGHDRPAHHDVVKMGYDEISVMHVNIKADGSQKHSGQPANSKETDESKGVKHRR